MPPVTAVEPDDGSAPATDADTAAEELDPGDHSQRKFWQRIFGNPPQST
ncbi:MAG: hypothetical protein Q4D85_09465 [Corynebacterium sp.]|nr:hypothetical protein [Corynebacterium sp.]MDO5098977.1 hypothetical protein [Corynebacterium sp.]